MMIEPKISQSIVLDPSQGEHIGIESEALPDVRDGQVQLRFLAAPINPLDLTVIDGVYPVKPQHHSKHLPVLGYDGIAEITETGKGVTDLAKGDLVVPTKHGLGTWRTSAVSGREWVERIPRPDDMRFGAIIKGSVVPAYFLIEDMVALKPGDWIIVNAGASIISQFVAQFARLKGVRTVSVIRDRDAQETQQVETALLSMGAELVLTEGQLTERAHELADLKIVMAIDSVFGTSGRRILDCLGSGGTYVQLGFLSGPASTISLKPTDVWGRQITMRPFRGSVQLLRRSEPERQRLFAWLVHAFNSKLLSLPALGLETVPWDSTHIAHTLQQVSQAICKARTAAIGQRKQVLVM